VLHPTNKLIINKDNMTYANMHQSNVPHLLYTLLTQTKAKKFRAGFIKKDGSYRVGKFDLKDRKTWKQEDGTMYKRKGKKRTTDAKEYILAHDLDKFRRPTNISIDRLLWFSVGKDLYTVNRLQANTFSVVLYDRVKFNHLKLLMSTKEVNVKIGLAMLNTKLLN
jgi:hypothetical protein